MIERLPENAPINDKAIEDFSFYGRQLFKAGFSFLEAVIYAIKVDSAATCLEEHIDISDAERYFAIDLEYRINSKGDIQNHPAKIPLKKNMRFAFRLLEKAQKSHGKFDPNDQWWHFMMKSIKVRDRLTHPRWPQDLEITGEDVVNFLKAKNGFDTLIASYK